MPSIVSKLVNPRYPATAIGLEQGVASVVHLERAKDGTSRLRRAATFNIAESLVRPSFDEPNIEDRVQLATVLNDLAGSAGLLRQKRWSLSLPEATTRTLVVTNDSNVQSGAEMQEVMNWKIERGFGASLEELFSLERKNPKRSAGT